MLEHQPPLDSPSEAHDSLLADDPGFRLQLVETGLLLIQSNSEPAVQEAVGELGLRLPATGETRTYGDQALLWLTPAEWILECPAKDTDSLHSALT